MRKLKRGSWQLTPQFQRVGSYLNQVSLPYSLRMKEWVWLPYCVLSQLSIITIQKRVSFPSGPFCALLTTSPCRACLWNSHSQQVYTEASVIFVKGCTASLQKFPSCKLVFIHPRLLHRLLREKSQQISQLWPLHAIKLTFQAKFYPLV